MGRDFLLALFLLGSMYILGWIVAKTLNILHDTTRTLTDWARGKIERLKNG